jgi:hypothetical protein
MSFWIPLLFSSIVSGIFTSSIWRKKFALPAHKRRGVLVFNQSFHLCGQLFIGAALGFHLGFSYTHIDMYGPLSGMFGGGIGSILSSLVVIGFYDRSQ